MDDYKETVSCTLSRGATLVNCDTTHRPVLSQARQNPSKGEISRPIPVQGAIANPQLLGERESVFF